nr:hypothetical protein [Paracoccus sp. M09]
MRVITAESCIVGLLSASLSEVRGSSTLLEGALRRTKGRFGTGCHGSNQSGQARWLWLCIASCLHRELPIARELPFSGNPDAELSATMLAAFAIGLATFGTGPE